MTGERKGRKQRSAERGDSPRKKVVRLSDDLLWGIHPVCECLAQQPDRISELIVHRERHDPKIETILRLARQAGIRYTFVDSLRLAGEDAGRARHQGVVARTTAVAPLDAGEFCRRIKARIDAGRPCRVVVLDSLQDAANVGAIVRSALASGAAGVLMTRERSAPLGGTAAKASAGALFHLDICQVTNLVSALKELKKIGCWVFGMVSDPRALSVYDSDLTVAACIVIGAEGRGIRPLVQKECDLLLSIPMGGELDSLNASVAAGVVLFEAMRQNLQSCGR